MNRTLAGAAMVFLWLAPLGEWAGPPYLQGASADSPPMVEAGATGASSSDTPLARAGASVLYNVGGSYNFTPDFSLLFTEQLHPMAGHSFQGDGNSVLHLGLYRTWGPGAP